MPRKNNSKQTIENIISISAQLFAEKGYDKTSMQEIVDALGMSKGAIFHHFRSKEDIFNAVMDKQFELVIEEVNQWLDEMYEYSAKEKLKRLIKRNISKGNVIEDSCKIVEGAVGSPQLMLAFTHDSVKMLAPIVAKLLREGIEDKSITTEFPDECAEILMLLLNFWCNTDDLPVLCKQFKFLQHLMRQLGVDIIEDETIDSIMNFYGPTSFIKENI